MVAIGVIDQAIGPDYALYQGDSAEVLRGLPSESVDFSVFSPPFQALYVYSATERDLGNCATPEEFFEHLSFITAELYRVLKPGRLMAVHCAQITAQKVLDGWIGLKDFRGQLIEHYGKHGFYFHREVCIDKDPQAQAIRTHSKALLFVQMRKDRSWIGPAIADFILVFRKAPRTQKCASTRTLLPRTSGSSGRAPSGTASARRTPFRRRQRPTTSATSPRFSWV